MSKKKTNEEFLEELSEINPSIEPLEEYTNAREYITCKCRICGTEWETTGDRLLNKRAGCPKCAIIGRGDKTRKTNNMFLKELSKVNNNIEPLEEYVNAREIINVKCKVCNHIWKTTPDRLINKKRGCPKCAGTIRKTNDKFVEDLKEVNPNIKPLEEYDGANEEIKVKCLKCNHIWKTTPDRLVRRKIGCPKCALVSRSIATRKTNEEFLEELKQINPNIEPLDDYVNYNTEIRFKCNTCGNIWRASPHRIFKTKHICNKCAIKKGAELCSKTLRKSNSKFIEELKIVNPNIEPLEDYMGLYTKIKFKCKVCDTEWENKPSCVLRGSGCPKCNNLGGTSREEQDLIDTLKETINSYIERGIRIKIYKETEENLKNKYLMEERKYFSNNGKRYQLDIYFPNLKLGIEYNGNYWHSTEKLYNNYHIDKREFFKELGIKVIFIRSDEWDFKREKILYRLMSILGLYKMKTYARKLYVDLEVSNFEANKLMELSHIQGKDNSSIKIGLRNKHETLVAVMTFGKSRYLTKTKDDGENTYELIRYCTYPESVVIGGFSKLLKAGEEYLKTLGVTRIKTFADRRFSSDDNNVYLKNGFTLSNISGANYVYVKGYEVLKRYECQKHKLHKILGDNFDENATEYENMVVNNGYTKICDCGNLVYYKNIE